MRVAERSGAARRWSWMFRQRLFYLLLELVPGISSRWRYERWCDGGWWLALSLSAALVQLVAPLETA